MIMTVRLSWDAESLTSADDASGWFERVITDCFLPLLLT